MTYRAMSNDMRCLRCGGAHPTWKCEAPRHRTKP